MDQRIKDLVNHLTKGNTVDRLVNEKGMDIHEAKEYLGNMSFAEYHEFTEATMIQPTNSFSTIKATYPNPIQVKQTQEPTPDSDSPEMFGALADPRYANARADKIAALKQRQATINGNKQQPGNSQTFDSNMSDDPTQVSIKQEDITPPSGQTVGPSEPTTNPTTPPATPDGSLSGNSNIKSLWPGKGAPAQVGMTVGLKGPGGTPVPGMISQVDQAAKGVKVKNPTTGQEEWTNVDALEPYMVGGQANQQTAEPAQPALGQPQATMEEKELRRILELAGLKETCSAGATGAGAIASAPAAMGTMKKRQYTDEELKKEYKQTRPAQTIVGDTKPGQASGELSANLAASGKKSAGRVNNGMKRRR